MTDRVLVATGAFGALGRAATVAALEAGWRVAAVDFAPPPLELAADILPLGGVDLSDPARATAAIEEVAGALGRIDALFNIAGGFRFETLAEGEAATWEVMTRLNLATAVNASRAALPHLAASGDGAIVNVGAAGAAGAVRAAGGMGPYAASKSGVHRLTEALAEEWKGKGVRVNAVLPSILDTPANRADMPRADFSKWVLCADLAAVMLFLASPAAKAVTGALVPVTGGV